MSGSSAIGLVEAQNALGDTKAESVDTQRVRIAAASFTSSFAMIMEDINLNLEEGVMKTLGDRLSLVIDHRTGSTNFEKIEDPALGKDLEKISNKRRCLYMRKYFHDNLPLVPGPLKLISDYLCDANGNTAESNCATLSSS